MPGLSADDVFRLLGSVVDGPVAAHSYVPPHSIDWQVSFAAFAPPILAGTSTPLGPGEYGDVLVATGRELRLQAGTYRMKSLTVQPGGRIVLDQSGGRVKLYVKQGLSLSGTFTDSQGGRANPLVGYFGDLLTAVINSPFAGTVIAPKGTLQLGALGVTVEGTFFARRVTVIGGTTVRFAP